MKLKTENLFPYIYDFLSLLFEDSRIKNMIRRVILFGSAARDEADKESDIDLFIDLWSKDSTKEVESYLKEVNKRFYLISKKKWELMGIKQPIKCVVGLLGDNRWKELRFEILSYSLILFGKYEELEENLKHTVIFSYSLSNLSQKRKMGFLRNLFGYKTVKGTKRYKHSGILQQVGGEKLGANVILIPIEKSKTIKDFLNSFGITPEIREVRIR